MILWPVWSQSQKVFHSLSCPFMLLKHNKNHVSRWCLYQTWPNLLTWFFRALLQFIKKISTCLLPKLNNTMYTMYSMNKILISESVSIFTAGWVLILQEDIFPRHPLRECWMSFNGIGREEPFHYWKIRFILWNKS